jgi:site-specific recombinase XerD
VRAARLVAWLVPIAQQAAQTGGQAIRDSALRPESDLARLRQRDLMRAPVTDLADPASGTDPLMPVAAPVMEVPLPDALSGRDGLFRAPDTNVWGAQTDVQAIQQWLSRYQGQTRRDYARIAERFYRWCLQVRRKALSSLQEPDLQAYQAFVTAPPPDWVQPRKVRREDAAWRPFRGPLGRNSQRHEFAVLGGLFAAMHDKGYLRANAMSGLGRALGLVKPSIDVRRSLNEAQWSFAMAVLRERPDTPARRRLQLLLELASTTGLRLSELATTRMKGLRQELVDGESAWLLDVIGKGGKLRTVMVFDDIRALMERHHADMDAAGVGFEDAVARVQVPNSLPTTAAGERMAAGGPGADGLAPTGNALQDALRAEHLQAWRPLIGILRRPPPRRDLDARGVPFVDREQPAQADRYGALERSAIYGLLRRFFRDVANAAATREGTPPAAEFLKASTHWLRHTFANEAIKQMQPQVLQSLLGHSDLRVTSVYVKAQAADLVRGMRALPRRG